MSLLDSFLPQIFCATLFRHRFYIQKMKNEPLPWREAAWRRKLTEAELKELQAQPEAQADLELESRLSEVLARVPEAPVPSNFTARVLQAIEREEAQAARTRSWSWYWRVLVPRVAVAAAVIGFASLTYQRYEFNQRVHAWKLIASQQAPKVEALKDFDAIQRLGQATPHADKDLLALLEK